MQPQDLYSVTIFDRRRIAVGATASEAMESFAANHNIFPGDFLYRHELERIQDRKGDRGTVQYAGDLDYLYLIPDQTDPWYVGHVPLVRETSNGNWHDRKEWNGMYFFVYPCRHGMTDRTEYELVHNLFNLRSVLLGESRADQLKSADQLKGELHEHFFGGFYLDQRLTTVMPIAEVSNEKWMAISQQYETASVNAYERNPINV